MDTSTTMDIFKMAEQIAGGMTDKDKKDMQGMDLEALMQKVSGSVFSHMKDLDMSGLGAPPKEEEAKQKRKRKKKKKPKRTPDIHVELPLDLEDFFKGGKKNIKVMRPSADGEEKVKLTVDIEPGAEDGHTFEFAGESGSMPNRLPGNVYVTLVQNSHAVFERDGDDLLMDIEVSLSETFGFKHKMAMIDGMKVELVSPVCIFDEPMLKLIGHGMPLGEERGDLYVRFSIEQVSKAQPTEEQLQVLRDLFPPVERDVPEGEFEPATLECLEGGSVETDSSSGVESSDSGDTHSTDELGGEVDSEGDFDVSPDDC